MLTSSNNQYLRPEYLNPLQGSNIELDAKKSPLALLAQTCSQIGADMPSKTPSIPPVDKSSSKCKSSASPGAKSPAAGATSTDEAKTPSSFKPYEKKKDDDDDCRSPKSAPSPLARSPPGGGGGGGGGSERAASRSSESGRSSSRPHDANSTSTSTSSRATASPSKPSLLTPHSLAALGDVTKDPLAAYKLPAGLYPSLPLGLDPLGAAGLSALTAKVPTSSSSSLSISGLSSPYIGYARVKTVSGSEAVVPVCRDPYCTGCQINAHAAQIVNGTCPPGCSQCAQIAVHTKNLAALPGLLPSIHPSSLGLYPPPGLVGGSHQPYVCNWIAGDTYCGKRFSTSEELLQHLRTHTNLSTSDSSLPLHAAAAAALHHPLLSGHLPRGYPTPPLSPLSAARYHPYAKPPTPLPPHISTSPLIGASAAALSLSALSPHPLTAAYYSPYSLYARGLGTATGLHP